MTEFVDNTRKVPRIFTFELHQDDPSKCTSAKMRKFGFAHGISMRNIPHDSIVLNPLAENATLLPIDQIYAERHGLVAIDCSWKKSEPVFAHRFRGQQRKLPALLAGNPTNYSKVGALSSLEAVAGALYIMRYKEEACRFLSIYKWGETFLSLNREVLEDYSKAVDIDDILEIERSYFPHISH